MTDLYVDTPEALERLCDQLRDSDWLALDTEFLREKSYYPRLCLLQVANEDLVACVDPLALTDLTPLLNILYDPAVTKVLHAAHQDLEIFYAMTGRVPAPVFDTQMAATVLGGGDQVGYGALVKAELDVDLPKTLARTDWCQRPLEPEQLQYAADDVRYLRDVYQCQLAQLQAQGREQWLVEDLTALSEAKRYANPPETAWLRIKGAGRLRGVQLAVLQALAGWRETEAQRSDRPRRWVLRDEVLLDIAKQMPDNRARLERIRGLEERVARRHGDALLSLVAESRQLPRTKWPELVEGPRIAPDQDEVVDAMMSVLRACCREHDVSPAAVAGRRDLERLLAGEDAPVLHGWRKAVAGDALLALLHGHLTLRVTEGRLRLKEMN